MKKELQPGMTATLVHPYKGWDRITLIVLIHYKWLVRLETGLELMVYEDEFTLD